MRVVVPWFAALMIALVSGCGSDPVEEYSSCILAVDLAPASGPPGATITATGGPFYQVYDSAVRVGGVPATVTAVVRTTCDACDACRADARCLQCGDCDSCESTCATCVQTLEFVVPDVSPGRRDVLIVTHHGASLGTAFDVPVTDDAAAPPPDTAAD